MIETAIQSELKKIYTNVFPVFALDGKNTFVTFKVTDRGLDVDLDGGVVSKTANVEISAYSASYGEAASLAWQIIEHFATEIRKRWEANAPYIRQCDLISSVDNYYNDISKFGVESNFIFYFKEE
jgi:hypothetical protein